MPHLIRCGVNLAPVRYGLLRRLADLAAVLPVERRVSARWGWAGEINSLLSILKIFRH
jgi:hypothetical protein